MYTLVFLLDALQEDLAADSLKKNQPDSLNKALKIKIHPDLSNYTSRDVPPNDLKDQCIIRSSYLKKRKVNISMQMCDSQFKYTCDRI